MKKPDIAHTRLVQQQKTRKIFSQFVQICCREKKVEKTGNVLPVNAIEETERNRKMHNL